MTSQMWKCEVHALNIGSMCVCSESGYKASDSGEGLTAVDT